MLTQKTILSLFDFSGIWSSYYKNNGYKVIQIDIKLNQKPNDIFDIDEKRNLRENTPTKYAFKLPVLKEATTWMAMFNDDFRKEYNITVQYK